MWRRARIARGESVIVTVEEGAIVVRGAAQAFEGAREMVRRLVPPGTGLVDDLIAERRREAGREERG
ncbi:MAG: AbrB/MazE/SpoVT family DNA-binding domain-containing protein [Alphaproteobacteria bacterium]|nr:AbrB/MazE/SpoVT family DNA-binding domain-containing protein [Alphaproteobacteria bacterium]